MKKRSTVSLQFCLGVKNWEKSVHVCLCLKRPAAIHKGQSLSLCMFRGIFSFTHHCFFFKIRGNHDHLSFFCCLSFFLSLVHQLVIVADRDHSMFVVQRHPGGQAADRTSSLEHKSFHKHLNCLLIVYLSPPFSVCIRQQINQQLFVVAENFKHCQTSLQTLLAHSISVRFLQEIWEHCCVTQQVNRHNGHFSIQTNITSPATHTVLCPFHLQSFLCCLVGYLILNSLHFKIIYDLSALQLNHSY